MLNKKISVIWLFVSAILLLALLYCLFNSKRAEPATKEKTSCQRIRDYTENYFRFLETANESEKMGEIKIEVSYIPEVGSVPIKQEIYQNAAYYALQVVDFFPEVSYIEYKVLWDDKTKDEAMTLKLDENALSNLKNQYYNQIIAQNDDEEISFQTLFTSVKQTDISNEWREDADKNSNLP